jgi:hypothetical protein
VHGLRRGRLPRAGLEVPFPIFAARPGQRHQPLVVEPLDRRCLRRPRRPRRGTGAWGRLGPPAALRPCVAECTA